MNKYYKILGLPPTAAKQEVKKQYRKLAFKYHPDKNPSAAAQAKFVKITKAYDAIISGKIPKEDRRRTSTRTSNTGSSVEEKVYKRGNRTYTQAEFDEHVKKARQKAAYRKKYGDPRFRGLTKSKLSKAAPFIMGFYFLFAVYLTIDCFTIDKEYTSIKDLSSGRGIPVVSLNSEINSRFSIEPLPERFIEVKFKEGKKVLRTGLFEENTKVIFHYHKLTGFAHSIEVPAKLYSDKESKLNLYLKYLNGESFYFFYWFYIIILVLPNLMFIMKGNNELYYIALRAGVTLPAVFILISIQLMIASS